MANRPQFRFWTPNGDAALEILKIHMKKPDYTMKDVVANAWHQIPRGYFPGQGNPTNVPRYLIQRENYSSDEPRESQVRPDLAVLALSNFRPITPNIRMPDERDVLWVECKPPCMDVHQGWNDAMNEAVERLHRSHPQRRVYLILAIGLKWMPFLWDPTSANSAGNELCMLAHDGTAWPVDPNIQSISALGLPQRHIVRDGKLIDSRQAYTLDYWTTDPNGVATHLRDHELLEEFFSLIQGESFSGVNE